MDLEERIDELLRHNLAKARQYGHHRAWIQVPEVQNEEWGKALSVPQVQELIERVLARPEWYPLNRQPSDRYGIIGYEYTDAEGAARIREYGG